MAVHKGFQKAATGQEPSGQGDPRAKLETGEKPEAETGWGETGEPKAAPLSRKAKRPAQGRNLPGVEQETYKSRAMSVTW